MAVESAPLFVLWEKIAGDLLERTARFPKAWRFSFAVRIDNLALDVLERLAEAQVSPPGRKVMLLRDADASLLRLKVLTRLAHAQRLMDHGGYEHVARSLDEVGRMLGGWLKQQRGIAA